MEKTYEAPSNEAPHMLLGYHQGRLMTYLLLMFMVMKQRLVGLLWFSCFKLLLLLKNGNVLLHHDITRV